MSKRIAVYQNCVSEHGIESRRYQFYGQGKGLQRAVRYAYHTPPKIRFLTIDAREFLNDPHRYMDEEAQWIERPDVES